MSEYDENKYVVGKAYETVGEGLVGGLKRWLVREKDTLMINVSSNLVTAHETRYRLHQLEDMGDMFKEIPVSLFDDSMRDMILELGIYKYFIEK